MASTETTSEAISLITTQDFDIFITHLPLKTDDDDLMPFAVVRHFLPNAIIALLAEHFNVREAAMAVQLEIDVLVKPVNVDRLMELIHIRVQVPASAVCSDADQRNAEDDGRLVYEGCDDERTNDELRTR